MRRRASCLVPICLISLAVACSEVGVQPIDDQVQTVVDDLLTIKGSVCTRRPEDVIFPVKIMLIVDCSGSMQFTDPSDAATTTVVTNSSTGAINSSFSATAVCLKDCTAAKAKVGGTFDCTALCRNPNNPGRYGAAKQLVERFKNNPAVSFSIIRFNGRITVNGSKVTAGSSTTQTFTRTQSTLDTAIGGLTHADITTDYEGALATAYQVLDLDMKAVGAVDRARTKYVIIFMSDGGPNPQCKEGCGNDPSIIPGVDNWCDVPRDEWCDSYNVSGQLCTDMTNWYPLLTEPCREYNSSRQVLLKVKEIMALGTQYSVGEIRLHTAYLFVPTLPKAVQDLMGVEASSYQACTTDANCPTGESCGNYFCRSKSEKLMMDMATEGDGVYRNFSTGQSIEFLTFNYATVSRPFGMTNLVVTNTNVLPASTKLVVDSDGDGVSDDDEFAFKSNSKTMKSTIADTDGDGYSDKLELEFYEKGAGFDPTSASYPVSVCATSNKVDSDGDGLTDCDEKMLGTDPKIEDTDRDRFPDGLEYLTGTDPLTSDDKTDMDFDGKLAGEEIRIHADPADPDPTIHSKYKYVYNIMAKAVQPDLRRCYDFTVRKIRLLTTLEKSTAGTLGYNELLVYFDEGPADDPLDYGYFKAACVRAQYIQDSSVKNPASGQVTLKPADFLPLPDLLEAKQAAAKDPACKTSPPGKSCKDPCKGARLP